MSETTPIDTRSEILRVSLHEFGARGYHGTSLRRIAERVGITKTAVLYHFPEKADIVAALAAPMLDDMSAALDAAAAAPRSEARWAVIERMLDVYLAHRHLLRLNLRDLALAAAQSVFDRFRDTMLRAIALVAGPRSSFGARVRAAQAMAMLGDPVVLFADASVSQLRDEVLVGVRRVLQDDGKPAGTKLVRRRGRPSALDPAMRERARSMYAKGSGVDDIAAAMGVSRATVYRHLGSAASKE